MLVTLSVATSIDAFAVGLSLAMLDIARARLPGVPLFQADMADFQLDEPADAVVCLFSSIGYLHTREDVDAAALCFQLALRPGGALLIEPFVGRDKFEDGRPHIDTYEDDDLKLARVIVTRSTEDRALLDFHWLVVPRNGEVEHFTERHELQFFDPPTVLSILEEACLPARLEAEGLVDNRGLIIAQKQ